MINELNNPGTTQRTPRGITQVSSAEAAVRTIANLCRSIDYVKDTGAKARHCNDLQKYSLKTMRQLTSGRVIIYGVSISQRISADSTAPLLHT